MNIEDEPNLLKILLINKFVYPKGGDAISMLNTARLLRERGHTVIVWGMQHPLNPPCPYEDLFISGIDYSNIKGIKSKISSSLNVLYSFEAKDKIERLIEIGKPDIVHLNNFAHQISPSILHVFKKYKIPMVMTMHDYKLVCPSYSMLLRGSSCEKCAHGRYYCCLINKCTKNSYMKSFVNTLEMYLHHNILHIYDLVDMYISPSKFLKQKVKEMGFHGNIVWLPNFVFLDGINPEYNFKEKSFVYVGRLSEEKGIFTLVRAIQNLPVNLKVIGDGPLRRSLISEVKKKNMTNVHFLGYITGEKLVDEMKNSIAIILPSECYENNPMVILEAFGLGKPAIGSRIGGIPELVVDGETGFTFSSRDAEDLRNKIKYSLENPDLIIKMGKNARRFVEENFNPEKHYMELLKIYNSVMKREKNEKIYEII